MPNCRGLMLPDGSCYDASLPQDHTGIQFTTRAKSSKIKDPRRDARNFMREPAWLQCPRCASEERFRILAESHPMGDGMMQIFCSKCQASWPVLQMQQPQMNDRIAHELGVESTVAPIEFEFDLERD